MTDEQEIRARLAAELRRAAAGRRHYADTAPDGPLKDHLQGEEHAFEQAARLALGRDPLLMLGIMPAALWTEEEQRLLLLGVRTRTLRAVRSDDLPESVEELRAELAAAKAIIADYESTLSWNTTCHRCADLLDASYAEFCGRETAEGQVARVRALSADMRTWCSPHDLALSYADRIDEALATPPPAPTTPGDPP